MIRYPWYPVIAPLHRWLGWRPDASPEAKLQRLEAALAAAALPLPDAVPLLAAFLALPLPATYPPLTLPPPRQKQHTLDLLLAWVLAEAAQHPVLFVVEDLQWSDPSTLELLSLLIDHGPAARLLTLLTSRPEFRPPWTPRAHVTHLPLGRLPRPQVEAMMVQVSGGKALPPAVVGAITAKTDGVPLFVEELTAMVLESGLLQDVAGAYHLTGPLPPFAIPTTLHGVLLARLDPLQPGKTVAQLGAVIGRTFAYALLQAIAPLDEAAVQHGVQQLVDAELVYQQGVLPTATYTFKHALLQDAAYQSLLLRTRRQVHQRLAQVLEAQCPATCATHPELLAQHYTQAGLSPQAIGYWQRAGQRASERSAYVEAIQHLRAGLTLLQALPETPARAQEELPLQVALGAAFMATKGLGAAEVARAYARARDLCTQVDQPLQVFRVLVGLWRFYLGRAEYQTARAVEAQLLRLAPGLQDPALLLEVHRGRGHTLLVLGHFVEARGHLEHALALYMPPPQRAQAFLSGPDAQGTCLAFLAWVLWVLGFPTQARQTSQEACRRARALGHPFSLLGTLSIVMVVHQYLAEPQTVQAYAADVLTLAADQEAPFYAAAGTLLQGWALAVQGQPATGMVQMRQGLAAWRATGAELFRPFYLALLAEGYGQAGQAAEGLPVLGDALAALQKTGERYYEAALYRLKGDLLLRQAVPEAQQAEACFQQARAVAQRQQARSWELRAALSLSRLWQRQGKRAEARQVLAPIYGWFTEGFETVDLQEAKRLLDELGP